MNDTELYAVCLPVIPSSSGLFVPGPPQVTLQRRRAGCGPQQRQKVENPHPPLNELTEAKLEVERLSNPLKRRLFGEMEVAYLSLSLSPPPLVVVQGPAARGGPGAPRRRLDAYTQRAAGALWLLALQPQRMFLPGPSGGGGGRGCDCAVSLPAPTLGGCGHGTALGCVYCARAVVIFLAARVAGCLSTCFYHGIASMSSSALVRASIIGITGPRGLGIGDRSAGDRQPFLGLRGSQRTRAGGPSSLHIHRTRSSDCPA
ncbi:hypothetical protein LZ30DRAFT_339628 [Colletotrichum cereale]|nr:hypothetical protein LZ30DRAFT_339628 [Colletotrichum cereale]